MNEKYNGWSNYATWNVYLWITNEERAYKYYKGMAAEFTADNVGDLAEAVKEEIMNGAYDLLPTASMYTDILLFALGTVNWYELANALMEM